MKLQHVGIMVAMISILELLKAFIGFWPTLGVALVVFFVLMALDTEKNA